MATEEATSVPTAGNKSEIANLSASVGANHHGVVLSLPLGDYTGSAVSTVTEQDTIESLPVPHVVTDMAGMTFADSDVPSQVILPAENSVGASGAVMQVYLPENGSQTPPLIVSIPPVVSSNETASCPPAPVSDATTLLEADVSKTLLENSSTPVVAADTANRRDIDHLDEYIRSPEVQNAIVERSPGGRYVRFLEKLGSGASKDVYRAYDTQEGIEVAWNVVNLSGVPKSERNRIVNEVRLLERLHHQNIISFHGSWVNRERQEVNFVTEILSSGTLKNFIRKVQLIRWKIAKRWATQILKGLEYLHSQDPPVIHRDLKAENIFINGTSGDLRIGDLGLSTVHRNGRVLSVLGTPEFMAPDMYEDGSYDVKVDIYAFGMVLLEIFTKEIPYSECTNPAQIYKKVSAGEPPEVLKRLESRHAREFVKLCLGYRDDSGNYIRPTATELLQHPFLEIREGLDDEEVLVRPSLRESTIYEVGETSSATSPIATPSKSRPFPHADNSTEIDNLQAEERPNTPLSRTSKQLIPSENVDEDDVRDRFDEMPQSETNMKPVKVLMGREHEVDETSQDIRHESDALDFSQAAAAAVQSLLPPEGARRNKQYLVAAAVVGPLDPETRPYPDDILKLVVTLPVDGQTQNVQFDFHLIEDDPVQVAKEMVQELDIPTDAILEISQTISGLARTARMQVEAFNVRSGVERKVSEARTNIAAGIHPLVQVTPGVQTLADPLPTPQLVNDLSSHAVSTAKVVPYALSMSAQNYSSIDPQGNAVYMGPKQEACHPKEPQPQELQTSQIGMSSPMWQQSPQAVIYTQPQPLLQHSQPTQQLPQQPLHQTTITAHIQPLLSSQPNHSHHTLNQTLSSQPLQEQQPVHAPVQAEHPYQDSLAFPVGPARPSEMPQPLQSLPSVQAGSQSLQQPSQHLSQHVLPPLGLPQTGAIHLLPHPTQSHASYSQFEPVRSTLLNDQSSALAQHALSVMTTPMTPPEPLLDSTFAHCDNFGANRRAATLSETTTSVGSVGEYPATDALHDKPVTEGSHGGGQMNTTDFLGQNESEIANTAYPMPEAYQGAPPKMVQRSGTAGSQMDSTFASSPSMNGSAESVSPDGSESAEIDSVTSDPEMDEELRRLEEEHKKNMQRTMKVFGNRMESLQRTIMERETQHRNLLEKHEKEKYEYQRRLAQEEEQQTRRLEQLQKEWEKKRDELAERRRVQEKAVNASLGAERHTAEQIETSDRSQGRTLSHTDFPASSHLSSPEGNDTAGLESKPSR